MVNVFHPVYAAVYPCVAEDAELASLLAQGWFLSREAMMTRAPLPSPDPPMPRDDIDVMIEEEQARESRKKSYKK